MFLVKVHLFCHLGADNPIESPAVTCPEISWGDIVTSSPSGTLNLSLPDAINSTLDPMQNPGQTQMTRKKSEPR